MRKITLILIFISAISCFENAREYELERKTKEIIYVVIDELKNKRVSPFCLTEKPEAVNRLEELKNDNIIEYLEITDSTYYWDQVKKQKLFVIKEEMVPKGVLILTDESININKESNHIENTNELEFLTANCKSQFTSISKPIFNEDLTKAFIETAYYCGWYCQGTNGLIFEWKNDKWEMTKSVYNWDY